MELTGPYGDVSIAEDCNVCIVRPLMHVNRAGRDHLNDLVICARPATSTARKCTMRSTLQEAFGKVFD